jgi:hypothetical protein
VCLRAQAYLESADRIDEKKRAEERREREIIRLAEQKKIEIARNMNADERAEWELEERIRVAKELEAEK